MPLNGGMLALTEMCRRDLFHTGNSNWFVGNRGRWRLFILRRPGRQVLKFMMRNGMLRSDVGVLNSTADVEAMVEAVHPIESFHRPKRHVTRPIWRKGSYFPMVAGESAVVHPAESRNPMGLVSPSKAGLILSSAAVQG
jgi:hypothetical protein